MKDQLIQKWASEMSGINKEDRHEETGHIRGIEKAA